MTKREKLIKFFEEFGIGDNALKTPVELADKVLSFDDDKFLKLDIEDIVEGEGKGVEVGDNIIIHYKGTLVDGKQFDSSYDRGIPFETQIGVGKLIKGWDMGILGMKVGGKRKLYIPSKFGYGPVSVGGGLIPAHSDLILEVELISIK